MTDRQSNVDRHLPLTVFESYIDEGVPGAFVVEGVDGTPQIRFQIAPIEHTISMLVAVTDNVDGPDVLERANVDYRLQNYAGVMWHRLDVKYEDNLAEIYPILCSVADRIQVQNETFTCAVDATFTGVEQILAGRGGLPKEKRVGLFGELVVLHSLATATSVVKAFEAWRGADNEEHDFGLASTDLEVKTTRSEERVHWIGSLTQLRASENRLLHLLSIQITAAGVEPGLSLAEIVSATRGLPGIPVADLNKSLRDYGYFDVHADLYSQKWRLRSSPAFYLVDDQFPALTRERLVYAVPNADRIVELRYRINVGSLLSEVALFPVEIPGFPE